jgi:hypothetical protein
MLPKCLIFQQNQRVSGGGAIKVLCLDIYQESLDDNSDY